MARPIKIKESDLTNMVKRILAEKGVVNEERACNPPYVFCHDCVGGSQEMDCDSQLCSGNPDCYDTIDFNKTVGGGGTGVSSEGQWEATLKKHDPKGTYKNYKKIDHDRGKFDGRASKVIGVDSDIENQRFEKNMKEGYRKYGCKFLQSRKSLNEDKLTHLFETDRDIREQNILSKKLRFIESAIKHTKCGTILREQKEDRNY